MKRIVAAVLLGMLTMSVHAKDPWAETEVSVAAREGRAAQRHGVYNKQQAQAATANIRKQKSKPVAAGKVTVLPRILAGNPITVSIFLTLDDVKLEQIAQKDVRQQYNEWFANAARWIKKQHREKEFADILPILERGIAIKFVDGLDPKEEDVRVFLGETEEDTYQLCDCDGCLGCEYPGEGKNSPMMVVVTRGENHVLLHEIGHTLGIADAHDEGYEKFASRMHRSNRRSTATIMYYQLPAEHLGPTADDADGLINIIDSWTIYNLKQKYASSWQQHASPRILNGWNSLDRYSTGTSVDRYKLGTSEQVLAQTQR